MCRQIVEDVFLIYFYFTSRQDCLTCCVISSVSVRTFDKSLLIYFTETTDDITTCTLNTDASLKKNTFYSIFRQQKKKKKKKNEVPRVCELTNQRILGIQEERP